MLIRSFTKTYSNQLTVDIDDEGGNNCIARAPIPTRHRQPQQGRLRARSTFLTSNADATRSFHSLVERLERAGFDRAFTHNTILPDWWDETCENDPELLPDFEFRTARFLNLPLQTIQDPAAALVQLRSPTTDWDVSPASIHAGIQIAQAVIRNLRDHTPAVLPPINGGAWHATLRTGPGEPVELHNIVGDLWQRHIPVVPVSRLPQPDFETLGCVIQGRPLVMMSGRITDRWDAAIHAAHQIGHIVAGDCANNKIIAHREAQHSNNRSEIQAKAFAHEVITGGTDRAMLPRDISWNAQDPPKVVMFLEQGRIRASTPPEDMSFLDLTSDIPKTRVIPPAQSTLFNAFIQNVDVDAASETDNNLLRCVDAGTRASSTH